MTTNYELFALRYAWRDARRQDHFFDAIDDPQRAMPMDYFVWVARSPERTVLIDTGFTQPVGERRGREFIRRPVEALAMVGVDPARIDDVILTHGHYDHIGTVGDFPNARLHLQELELGWITGRNMLNPDHRRSFEHEDVSGITRALFEERLHLYNGSAGLFDGLSVHLIGGHTPGIQVVRVHTARGWVVLASDTTHYFENMEAGRPFATTYSVDDTLAGFRTLQALADSPSHIVPGHDPLVMQRYDAPSPELAGAVVRLDVAPHE